VSFSRRTVVWVAALIVVVNGFFPAVWILLTSLKTETEFLQVPITYLPAHPTLDNYVTAFTAQPILRFMFNSFVVASLSTILCVFVSALAAYALTRLRIPKRNLIMSLLLAVAMFPLISLMVPLFKLMRELGAVRDRRQRAALGEHDDLRATREHQGVRRGDHRVGSRSQELREGLVDFARIAGLERDRLAAAARLFMSPPIDPFPAVRFRSRA